MPTFRLHWVPHRKETDGTLVPLQEWVDKFGLVARHLLFHYVTVWPGVVNVTKQHFVDGTKITNL